VDSFACAVNATTGAMTATITGRLVFGSLARTAAYRLAFAESAPGSGGSGVSGDSGGGGSVRFELDIDSGDARPALNQAQLVFDSPADEHVYGFGNQYSFTDLRGQVINAWIRCDAA
jgi:hypothetical protein